MDASYAGHTASSPSRPSGGYLTYLPVGFFGSATGIAGLGLAWRLAHLHFGLPLWPATTLALVGLVAFLAIGVAYFIKVITAPKVALAEFRDPVSGSLYLLIPINFLLLPVPLAPYFPVLATALWVIGAITSIVLSCIVTHRWLSARQQVEMAVPAWIVTFGGPMTLPIALPALGLTDVHELAVFALAYSLFFCIPVFTMVLSRLIFQGPPPTQAKATLLILTAPFSIGYSSYVVVAGQHDLFSQSLYMVNLFLLIVLLGLLVYLPQCCPFRLSWWAVGFPLASSTSAALRFASVSPGSVNDAIAIGLLGLSTTIILGLFVRTIVGLARGELRTLTGP